MKTRIPLFYPLLLLVLALSTIPIKAQVILDSCQQKARDNYPMIKQYDFIEKSKELSLSNANKNYLPKFDINLIGGVIDGFPSFSAPGSESSASSDFNLIAVGQINQLIWDGGLTKASKGIIEANAEIEKAGLSVMLYQLEDRVNNLFFGILLIEEQQVQLNLLAETLDRNYLRIENAVENGSAFRSDLDELMVEIINVQQKKEELEYNKQSYIKMLSLMTGEEIPMSSSFVRPELSLFTDSLEIQRPEMKKFEMQRNAVSAKAQLDKAMLFPKVGLLGFGVLLEPGPSFGTSTLDHLLVAGLSLSWSLDPFYKNGNNKKLTDLNLQRIQNQEETFLFNTELELSQTEMELNKLEKLIEQDQEILRLKTKIRDAYSTKYDNGVATLSEMLDKVNDENAAKQNKIMHEIQYLMKSYQYLNKSGN